jgi:hypothetical protein
MLVGDAFLDETILGPTLRRIADRRGKKPEPQDVVFDQIGGVPHLSGRCDWVSASWSGATAGIVVDVRATFPNVAVTREYMRRQIPFMAEGLPHIERAPAVAEDCFVFAGNALPNSNLDGSIFTYVFRVGATVVRVTVGAGQGTPEDRVLTLPKVRTLAEIAALRVRSPGAAAPDPSKLEWLQPPPPLPPRPREKDDIDCPSCGAAQRPYYKFCLKCRALLENAAPGGD